MQDNTIYFDFSQALLLAKQGKKISRRQFRNTCYIMAQYPTPDSKITLPYLYMVKYIKPEVPTDITREEMFPVDLSCESIFATDWYEVF